MTTTIKAFLEAKFAESSQTTQWSATTKAIVDKFTATNTTATSQQFKASLVQSGQSAASAPMTVVITIPAGKTYQFPEIVGHPLEAGDFISTIATNASAVAIRIGGREIT
jgi:hypothetical protein